MTPPENSPQKTAEPQEGEGQPALARRRDADAEAEQAVKEGRASRWIGPAEVSGAAPPKALGAVARDDAGAKAAGQVPSPEKLGLDGDTPPDSGAAPALGQPKGHRGEAVAVEARPERLGLDRPSEPGEATEEQSAPRSKPTPKPRHKRRRHMIAKPFIWALDVVVIVVLAVAVMVFVLAGKELPAPDWLAARVEAELTEGMGGATVNVGELFIIFSRTALPRVSFRDVDILAVDGTEMLHVPAFGASLDRGLLLAGQIQPRAVQVEGAAARLSRRADGTFDLELGDVALDLGGSGRSLAELIDAIDRMFALPSLAPIEEIAATDMVLEVFDARSTREWVLYDGDLVVRQDAGNVSGRLALQLAGELPQEETDWAEERDHAASIAPAGAGSGAFEVVPAAVELTFASERNSTAAELGVRVDGVSARDIAAQSPATAFLALLDAPISGAFRARVNEDGALAELAGQLEIGAGQIEPGQGQAPVGFDGGRSYFHYQPDDARVVFDELRLAGPDGAFSATGHAYLEGIEDTGWPTRMIAQLQFQKVRLNPTGLLRTQAEFDRGALDMKLTLDPFEFVIGQMALSRDDLTLNASGAVRPRPEGWEASLDFAVDRMSHERLLDLWPLPLASKTRNWISERVLAGELFNVQGALRMQPGAETPLVNVVYEFRDGEVVPLPTLPPVTGASGYSSISGNVYTLSLDKGQMAAPEGGMVDVTGSVLRVPDITKIPAQGEIELRTESSITAALSLLDQEPWHFLTKAKQPVDIAAGRAALEGLVTFPLMKNAPKERIQFRVAGKLSGVRSSKVVPGRVLTAEALDVVAHNEEIMITGPGRIEGLPITATWVQPLKTPKAGSRVEGTIELSQAFVDKFNIGLPRGMVSGAGTGQFAIDLAQGRAPRFTLASDLNRMGLRISELGWSMGKSAKGSLRVEGQLGEPAVISNLSLKAPGLMAEGKVTLNPGGGLKAATFSRVKAGAWIDAPVTLTGRGRGVTPAVRVSGGWVDIRKTSFGQGGGGDTAGAPMRLALDRLVISDSIALTGFSADLKSRGGLNGSFKGLVNGAAPISGTLVPVRGKTAVRFGSDDAGRVFRAAGLFRKAKGGSMELTLTPRRQPGVYDGALRVKNVRVQSAPGLAALLNAISVVGLLEQLQAAGILLTHSEVDFVLTPGAVQITKGSGVGPSLGISVAGLYDMNRDYMQVQGVFSPIYVVNGIGQIISKKGEGLFGFNYRMTGPASAPKVSVNPLSVLTPGIFREIFRRPPPTLKGTD
ncbi:hypothetical protein [Vannielia sp.]|uniref:hypothetical protein n=1 Tax=Vannielia sp. TaxID=2813045 RepID=UPI00261BC49B|nr:hypothetical protein [Vannielia sp.]MDF1871570.1 hypothetical protein [Vannielia sp.]